MSLKVGDRVKGVKFKEGFNDSGLHFNKEMEKHIGKIGTVLEYTNFHAFGAVRIQFENGEQWVYPEEVLSVIETKKEKVMSDIKIAAYAVVNTKTSKIVGLEYTREEARYALQLRKSHLRDSFKIVKLQPEKWVR